MDYNQPCGSLIDCLIINFGLARSGYSYHLKRSKSSLHNFIPKLDNQAVNFANYCHYEKKLMHTVWRNDTWALWMTTFNVHVTLDLLSNTWWVHHGGQEQGIHRGLFRWERLGVDQSWTSGFSWARVVPGRQWPAVWTMHQITTEELERLQHHFTEVFELPDERIGTVRQNWQMLAMIGWEPRPEGTGRLGG